MSAWDLPVTVDVNGQPFVIRSDFRAVLDALAALSDPELTQAEQLSICLQILFPDWEQLPDAQAAFTAAMVFVNCGEPLPEHQLPKPRLVDWEKDAGLIAPAIDKVLGYSCRRCPYLNIRAKRAKGKRLEKHEQEFARENEELIRLSSARSAEEQAEKDRLLAELDG